ncbi:MAG: tetratricopeptide repeat protein [Deltaproteobacteria bacterium]|nr:tetratricopeptide repeat protein [Deltaproteobacteria bacterium]
MRRWKTAIAVSAVSLLLAACGSGPQPLPPRLEEAATYAEKGLAAFRNGCIDEAEGLFLASLEVNRSLDDRERTGQDLNRLSVLYAAQGRTEEALKSLDQAEYINKRGNHVSALFANLLNRGRIYIKTRQWEAAVKALEEARLLSPLTDEELSSWYALKGYWHLEQGRIDDAIRELEEAEKRSRPEVSPRASAALELHMARAFQATGRLEDALERAQRALELDKKVAYAPGIGEDLVLLSLLAEQSGRLDQAADFAERAFYVHYYLGHEDKVRELLNTLERLKDDSRVKRLDVYLKKGEREGFRAYCP